MKKLKTSTAYRSNLTSFATGEEERGFKYYYREMNDFDKPVKVVYYNPNGEERLIETFVYDQRGQLVEELSNHLEEEMIEKTTYKYDDKGNCVETADYYGDEIFERVISRYNDTKHKTESIRIDEDENELEKDTFEYNAEGKLLKHTHYSESGEPDWSLESVYNAQGKVTEEIKRDLLENKFEKTVYEYNEEGKLNRSESKNERGEIVHIHSEEFDENGNTISSETQSSVPYSSHTTRTTEYDEENRPVESMLFDQLNNFLLGKEVVSYDEEGQIITQEVFELRAAQGMIKTHFLLQFENEYIN